MEWGRFSNSVVYSLLINGIIKLQKFHKKRFKFCDTVHFFLDIKHIHSNNNNTNYLLDLVSSKVAQSCPTLCSPMDCSLPGSSVHGIFQARVLEWVAISFSRGSSRPRDWTQVFSIADRRFTVWTTYLTFHKKNIWSSRLY